MTTNAGPAALIMLALLSGCARSVTVTPDARLWATGDAPERRAAAERALRESAGHDVAIDIDAALGAENRTDIAVARLDEALAAAIDRQNLKNSCSDNSQCQVSYRAASEADTLGLARSIERLRVVYMAPAKRDEPHFDPASKTLNYPFPPDASIENVDARDAIHAVIYDTLQATFTGRDARSVRDNELPRYVLWLAAERCAVDALAGVYARTSGATREFAREMLSARLTRSSCGDDEATRRAWTAWYVAYNGELDDAELRAASGVIFPPSASGIVGVPAPAELSDLRAVPYAVAVLKRALRDPHTREAKVLACTDDDRCMSPLYDYFASSPTEERSTELARLLVAEHSPALTTLAVRHSFASRALNVKSFLDHVAGDPEVWVAALIEALRANAYGADDTLGDIWARHPPLRAAMFRAADAASDTSAPDTQRHNVISGVTRLGLKLCQSEPQTKFFALLEANVRHSSPLHVELTKNGASCAALERH